MEWEHILQQVSGFDIVTGETGKILDDQCPNLASMNISQHTLKFLSVGVGACSAVINVCISQM